MTTVRVQFGVQEDARRVVFDVLAKVPALSDRERARLASGLVAALRDGDCLAQSVEQHYNATQAAQLLGRCTKYVGQQAAAGKFGPVMRDDGGWLIPASGVQRWLAARLFSGSVSIEEGKAA